MKRTDFPTGIADIEALRAAAEDSDAEGYDPEVMEEPDSEYSPRPEPDELLQNLFSAIHGTPSSMRRSETMDASDYHNVSVHLAETGRNRKATEICSEGLSRFPGNIDLTADAVYYSVKCGEMETAAEYYAQLKEKPYVHWNWRAFTFSLDYLRADGAAKNEAESRALIAQFRQVLPYEEKAALAESNLEEALGNADTAMQVLEDAIRKYSNAPQCALRLADMQFDRGMFREAKQTALYGIAASAAPQPAVNVPYLRLLATLAEDHILHMKAAKGETVSRAEIEHLTHAYHLMKKKMPISFAFRELICTRTALLAFLQAE